MNNDLSRFFKNVIRKEDLTNTEKFNLMVNLVNSFEFNTLYGLIKEDYFDDLFDVSNNELDPYCFLRNSEEFFFEDKFLYDKILNLIISKKIKIENKFKWINHLIEDFKKMPNSEKDNFLYYREMDYVSLSFEYLNHCKKDSNNYNIVLYLLYDYMVQKNKQKNVSFKNLFPYGSDKEFAYYCFNKGNFDIYLDRRRDYVEKTNTHYYLLTKNLEEKIFYTYNSLYKYLVKKYDSGNLNSIYSLHSFKDIKGSNWTLFNITHLIQDIIKYSKIYVFNNLITVSQIFDFELHNPKYIKLSEKFKDINILYIDLFRKYDTYLNSKITPLRIKNKIIEKLLLLEENGILFNITDYILRLINRLIKDVDKYNNTLLHHACFTNNEKLVKLLLQHPDIDVNFKNKVDKTPFDLSNSSIKVILLKHPDININLKESKI